MSHSPLVTVVMPAHNTEAFIGPAIQSILNQDFADFELWVLENGSKDRTAQVARGFADPRVRVFELGPVGFQGALTFALQNCGSTWLARMDSDDLCLPSRLGTQLKLVEAQGDLVMVGTAYAFLTPFGHVIERLHGQRSRPLTTEAMAMGGCRPAFPKARFCADASMLFRRDVALNAGGYDTEFTMGDVPLWLRMLEQNKGWEIAAPLYLYRLLPASFSTTHSEASAVRAKYAKAQLASYATIFSQPLSPSQSAARGKDYIGYWRNLAFLELIAGDNRVVKVCIKTLLELGDKAGAGVVKRRLFLQRLWPRLCALRHFRNYRRRLDFEQTMNSSCFSHKAWQFISPDRGPEHTTRILNDWCLLPRLNQPDSCALH